MHYWKLFGNDQLAPLAEDFGYDVVRSRLLRAAALDDASYETYRQQVIDFRNKYVSHREWEVGSITFPNLKKAADMILELRELLEETARAELAMNPGDEALEDLVTYYETHSNQILVNKCRTEARAAIGADA